MLTPLWVYNTVQFGQPFYNFNYTHALWLDNWYQVHAANLASLPTMSVYLKSHALIEILEREWAGIYLTKNLFGYSLVPWGMETFFQRRFVTWALVGIVTLLLAFHRQVWDYVIKHKELMVSGIVLLAATVVPLSWFLPISPNPRFFLPVVPMFLLLLVVASRGLLNWLLSQVGGTGRWLKQRAFIITSLLLIIIFGTIMVWPLEHVQANPFQVDQAKNIYTDQVLAWLAEGVREKTTVLFGTSHALPLWKYSDRFDFLTVPTDITNWLDLIRYAEDKDARFVIVDYETLLSRSTLMGKYFEVDQRQIAMKQPPPGVALTYMLDKLPANFLIFEVLTDDTIENPLNVRFGDDIGLIGYTLHDPVLQPDQTVSLTLYWRPGAPVSRDATVFTHLLDASGILQGQVDSQPLRGALPTTTWSPGAIIADRYDIRISHEAPAGDYRITFGMYMLQDLQRLKAVGQEGNLPDNQVMIKGPLVSSAEPS